MIDKSQSEYRIQQSSLDEYLECIKETVEGKDLPVQDSEMRYTGIEVGFNGLLGMTHSSRVLLKLMNDEAESGVNSCCRAFVEYECDVWRTVPAYTVASCVA